MNTGLGFSEIALILTLVLVFFGSKEIPQFIRVVAKFMAKMRFYTNKIKQELDSVTQSIDPQIESVVPDRKSALRKQFLSATKSLTEDIRKEKSAEIFEHLKNWSCFQDATNILIYVNMGSEVETRPIIDFMLKNQKRVIIPYCKDSSGELGIAEINNLESDICKGALGAPEVLPEKRKLFFKSDLQLIICPGLAFDHFGARLGRGKASYDRFLKEIKGQIPITGLAFECQICSNTIPFDYHDVPMDQIITEQGMLLKYPLQPETISSKADTTAAAAQL